jgi:transposase
MKPAMMERMICWRIPCLRLAERGEAFMAKWRQAVELAMTNEEAEVLAALSRSRTEPASRVSRAAILLAYRENPSFFAVGQRLRVHHQTVQRCVERAVAYGALAALDDRPRPGKEPTITPEAKAWLVSLACDKAKDHGYPHELWTTRLLARHAREHGPAAGHDCLARLVQGTVCKLLGQEEIKPHKVRYDATSSAVRTPGSSWVRMRKHCCGSGRKSAARSPLLTSLAS